ncbi:rhodanese-like domain-containing protein [Psychromonas sp.]|uniref:rhodanese-like domain-containing protein n=1 Tax=Psychromonas sp. TaxID=1884585 RepID=UPI0039E3144C
MKLAHMIRIAALLLFSVCAQAKITQIEPQVLLNKIDNQQTLAILDVRSEQEFLESHIQGAINIPYDQLVQNKERIAQYKTQPLVIYCRSGRRAHIAYQTLQGLGFNQLMDLKGHINLWQKLDFPLVTQ